MTHPLPDVGSALSDPGAAGLGDALHAAGLGIPGGIPGGIAVLVTAAGPLVRLGLAVVPSAALRGRLEACVRAAAAGLFPGQGPARVVYEIGPLRAGSQEQSR